MSSELILYFCSKKFQSYLETELSGEKYVLKALNSLNQLEKVLCATKFKLLILSINSKKKSDVIKHLEILSEKNSERIPLLFLCEDKSVFDDFPPSFKNLVTDYHLISSKDEDLSKKVKNLLKWKNENISHEEFKNRFEMLVALSHDGVWEFDISDQKMIIHKTMTDLLEKKMKEGGFDNKIITLIDFINFIHPQERRLVKNCINNILDKGKFEVECRIKNCEGIFVFVKIKGVLLANFCGQPQKILGAITFLRRDTPLWNKDFGKENLDVLTGLLNRDLFYDHLKLAIAYAKRYKCLASVLLLDIDHFKRVNDSLGHDFGDALLKEVSERLKPCIRSVDTLARMGGDEFIFILVDVKKAQNAVSVANKVLKVFQEPFKIQNHEIFVTASIGISIFPDDGENIENLVKNADTAMYRAKNQGRNTYQLYAPEMNARTFEILALENRLRKGISQDEFTVYYQPRINIRSGKILGVEALVRWQHPDLGLVPPSAFIPLAEETGLIVPLGEQVLIKACNDHARWMKEGIASFQIAVNLSARQFQKDGLVDDILKIVEKSGVNIRCLELEITESMAMNDVNLTIKILNSLRSKGIRIAMDDFGTGYSSLSYLKKYPINILKIDQSFIREMILDQDVVTIVKAIIELAKGLRLDMVVEGVETYEQLEMARSLGCIEMQGYLFSPPMPAEEIEPMLKKEKIFLTGFNE